MRLLVEPTQRYCQNDGDAQEHRQVPGSGDDLRKYLEQFRRAVYTTFKD